MTKKSKFQQQCEEVATDWGVEVFFIPEDVSCKRVFEDDGTLHIQEGKLRACFDVGVGQSLDGVEQNKNTVNVLKALKMEKYIGDRTLVEEDEEEDDDCCHECGRPY